MSAWFSLWKRSLDVASGAPEVIAHRTAAMNRLPWTTDTALDCNRMVAEKMMAAGESWWSLWRDATALQPLDGASHERAVRAAHRALKPYSQRVAANKTRLRKVARGR